MSRHVKLRSLAPSSDSIKLLCKDYVKHCTLVEFKEPIPPFRGTDEPVRLRLPHPGYSLTDTPASTLLKTVMSRMFGEKHYRFRLSTALNMSSSGTGIVNSVIATSSIQFNGDFIALSGVFNEFFLTEMRVKWEPVSMYNGPLGYLPATTVASLPLGCAALQHAQPVYTSQAVMTENYAYEHYNTGRPFSYSWLNVEKPNSTVVVAPVTSGSPCQSWCQCSDSASLTGTLQFLTQSAPPGLPVTAVLGTFLVEYDVLFRVRL